MKLTLRDLFWLVLVCALGIALWSEHEKNAAIRVQNSDLAAEWDSTQKELVVALKHLDVVFGESITTPNQPVEKGA